MEGCVFSVEEFSVFDGPGIRSTVFLKGCPLGCSWCHNPEGQAFAPQILRSPNGCIGCGSCERTSRVQDGIRVFTQESIKKCPMGLLRICGETVSGEALCQRLLKNKPLLLGGGITFSGGEPLAQPEFLLECLGLLRGQVHTAVQTSGYSSEGVFREVLALADYFLFDLKLADDSIHRAFTGVSNRRIHQNFALLARSGKDFVVRIPLIPGVTDRADNIEGLARLLEDNGVGYAELLPYNTMAGGKYKMLQRQYQPGFDESATVEIREDIFQAHHIQIRVL